MVYGSSRDPYCYPGTSVLRNKAGIDYADVLSHYEAAHVRSRAEEPWPPGKLDKPHYYALHRHLFQDVYAWAGKARTIRIAKGGSSFCYPDYIDGQLDRLFADLRQKRHLVGLPLDDFAREAAHVIAEVNAVHPFREGNGRTQLAFLRLLCLNAGWRFDASVLERERVIGAMIESFGGKPDPLAALVRDLASPKA